MRPSHPETRIQSNGFGEGFGRSKGVPLQTVDPPLESEATEKSVVSRGIVSRPNGNLLFFSAGESGFKLIGDRSGDLRFDTEDIVQFAVVSLGPEMFVGGRADQLHIDMHR